MTIDTAASMSLEDFDAEFHEIIARVIEPDAARQMNAAIERLEESPLFNRWVERGGLTQPPHKSTPLAVAFAFGLCAAAAAGEIERPRRPRLRWPWREK